MGRAWRRITFGMIILIRLVSTDKVISLFLFLFSLRVNLTRQFNSEFESKVA